MIGHIVNCPRCGHEFRRRFIPVGFYNDFTRGVSRIAAQLHEFHTHPNSVNDPGTNGRALRRTLHVEEHEELLVELDAEQPDRAKIARELADVVYVAYGSAWAYDIDLDAALDEVHRAAMDKMEAGVRREDGKIIKPPGFVPPDMTRALRGRT